ncbi:MAG: hypothetical protein ABEJ66_02980, partial [Candidatus Nanohaloarchaea archaeon]
ATSRGTGQSFSVEGIVDVIKEHEVDVSVSPASQTACLGEKVTYQVAVTNEGIQKEEFALTTEHGKLTRN